MDAAASIIAIVQLCEKVIKYVNSASGAKADRARLRDQVRACSTMLLQLKDESEDSEEGQAWLETIVALTDPLKRLHKALEMAAAKLLNRDSVKEMLKWPFKEKEVQKLMVAIESEKSLLALALNNNSARLLHEINVHSKASEMRLTGLSSLLKTHVDVTGSGFHNLSDAISTIQDSQTTLIKGVENVHERQTDQESSKERLNILNWLSSVDHASQQHDVLSRRQRGTGNWFLQSDRYQKWRTLEKSILFCPGIPGAGKTTLTSIIVADLWEMYHNEADVAIAFYYCNFRRQIEQTLVNVFSSILKQLVEKRPAVSNTIREFYNRFDKGDRRPLWDDLLPIIRVEGASFSRVLILVDALDECQGYSELTSELFDLQQHCNLNLLATSRFIPDILTRYEGAATLDIYATTEDVQRYLEAHIHRLPRFVARNSMLQEEIKTRVAASVEGTYVVLSPLV
jgi:hypothetical protein